MIRILPFIFSLLASSFAAELTIPNLSPIGWTPGSDVGVSGGIAQFLPGGGSQRTTLHDVTAAPFSVSNTGSAEVNTSINANISAVATNQVLYFPYGLYYFDNAVNLGSRSITVRGAGDGVLSTSSVTIGTGSKSFSVSPGLGWTPGVGIRVWHVTDRHKWMQGTVTSYSGTLLTINVTSTNGSGTLNFWTVGQTVMFRTANVAFFNVSGGSVSTVASITGSPTATATTIDVDSTAGFGSPPLFCQITQLNEADAEQYHHWPMTRTNNQFFNVITGIAGNTLTLARPIVVGLPSGQTPKIAVGPIGAKNLGFEYFAAFGNSDTQVALSLSGAWDSWIYHVAAGNMNSYTIALSYAVGAEMAYSFIGGTGDGADPTAAPVSMGAVNYCLIRHCILKDGLTTEGVPDNQNAFIYNLGVGYYPTANHGAGSKFRVFEYNIFSAIHFDGYHGGCQVDSVYRNWFTGSFAGFPQGYIIQNRYVRNHNVVGNILGTTGVSRGGHSMGNPNGGNADNDGVTVEPALYASSGGMSGSQFIHDDVTGNPRLVGTVTVASNIATVTLGGGRTYEFDLSPPQLVGANPTHLVWGTGDSIQYRAVMTVDPSSAGSTIVLTGGFFGSATAFQPATSGWPSNGTTVWIKPAEYGHQELDGSVEATGFIFQNYIYGAAGAPGGIDHVTADTLPASLVESGTPSDWPTGTIAYPPPFNTASPNSMSYSLIPAGFYYVNGYWPTGTPGGGGNFTVAGTATVTGTTTFPP